MLHFFTLFQKERLIGKILVDDAVTVKALEVFAGESQTFAVQCRPGLVIIFPAMHQLLDMRRFADGESLYRPAVHDEIQLDARCAAALVDGIEVDIANSLVVIVEKPYHVVVEAEIYHPVLVPVLVYLTLKQA